MDSDPYYGRRLRGTPAYKFSIKFSLVVLGGSVIVGVGCHFLMKSLTPPAEKPAWAIKFSEYMQNKRAVTSASLLQGLPNASEFGYLGKSNDSEKSDDSDK